MDSRSPDDGGFTADPDAAGYEVGQSPRPHAPSEFQAVTEGHASVAPQHFPGNMTLDGRIAWAFGLLALIGLPFLSLLAPSITMIIVGLKQRRKNPVAARTGRNAAIFGSVHLLIVTAFITVGIAVSLVRGGGVSSADNPLLVYLFVIPVGIYLAIVGPLINVIMAIIAFVRPVSRAAAQQRIEASLPSPIQLPNRRTTHL